MFERDEGRPVIASLLLEIMSDLIVSSGILVFANESSVDLGSGVSLLGWCVLIGCEHSVHEASNRSEDWSGSRLDACIGCRLGLAKCLANRVTSDAQLASDLTNAQAVAVQSANLCEIVHCTHLSPLRPASTPNAKDVLQWSSFSCRGWSRITRRLPQGWTPLPLERVGGKKIQYNAKCPNGGWPDGLLAVPIAVWPLVVGSRDC